MSVVIQSIIKTNPAGRWYIELIDPNEADTQERNVCLDIYEYAQKMEVITQKYANEIEVAWESQENVTPVQINEVRQQIMAYDAEQEAKQEAKMNDALQETSQDGAEWAPRK